MSSSVVDITSSVPTESISNEISILLVSIFHDKMAASASGSISLIFWLSHEEDISSGTLFSSSNTDSSAAHSCTTIGASKSSSGGKSYANVPNQKYCTSIKNTHTKTLNFFMYITYKNKIMRIMIALSRL